MIAGLVYGQACGLAGRFCLTQNVQVCLNMFLEWAGGRCGTRTHTGYARGILSAFRLPVSASGHMCGPGAQFQLHLTASPGRYSRISARTSITFRVLARNDPTNRHLLDHFSAKWLPVRRKKPSSTHSRGHIKSEACGHPRPIRLRCVGKLRDQPATVPQTPRSHMQTPGSDY